MKNEIFAVRVLKGIGYWLLGYVLCLFICIMMLMIMNKVIIIKVFVGFCVLSITLGLYFNYAHYAAKRDKVKVKLHGAEYDKFMPIKMAISAPFFTYIMWFILLLSKLGVIGDIFNYYVLTNIEMLPFVALFTTQRSIESLSWLGLFGILVIVLLSPAVIIISYIATYKDIDIRSLIFYKKDDNKK